MDHEAFEKQMINNINHKADEKIDQPEEGTSKKANPKKGSSLAHEKQILKRGLRRTILALMTSIMFAFAVCCLIAVASAPGYLAVLLFFMALISMGLSFILLYAQGIAHKIFQESEEDNK